jgi:hypothetical protein
MKGTVSFHPIDVAFFDGVIGPLCEGGKINPEVYLRDALRIRPVWWQARRFARGLESLATRAVAPEPSAEDSFWSRVRTRLERIDHRPEERAVLADRLLERDLHLRGRPFFVTEGSAERVAECVDRYRGAATEAEAESEARSQLKRLDPRLDDSVEPVDAPDLTADLVHRNDLLQALKEIFDVTRAAREGGPWRPAGGAARPAADVVAAELPWRALSLHARVVPFWIADDVDGLETVCRSAGVPPPECLAPAWRLFAPAIDAVPQLKEKLGLELRLPRDVGAVVLPGEVAALLEYLEEHGARIIQAAARAGEGPAATVLLRKIKECAVYASRHGLGYLEGSGIRFPDLLDEAEPS